VHKLNVALVEAAKWLLLTGDDILHDKSWRNNQSIYHIFIKAK